jgi:hypothetical protein
VTGRPQQLTYLLTGSGDDEKGEDSFVEHHDEGG